MNMDKHTEIQVLPGDDPAKRTIGFSCYESLGCPVVLLPEGFPEGELTPEQTDLAMSLWQGKRDHLVPLNGLKEGDSILVGSLFGVAQAKVTGLDMTDGSGKAVSGYNLYWLSFEKERQCWTSLGACNLKAIQKLELFSER